MLLRIMETMSAIQTGTSLPQSRPFCRLIKDKNACDMRHDDDATDQT